jgi:hypothetical protein
VKATELTERIDACHLELLALADIVKTSGVEAEFPYPHHWNAYEVADRLAKAHHEAAEAARLVAKVSHP